MLVLIWLSSLFMLYPKTLFFVEELKNHVCRRSVNLVIGLHKQFVFFF